MANDIAIATLNFSDVNLNYIGKILSLRKRLSEDGRTIRIKGCSESLCSTFELIKFDKHHAAGALALQRSGYHHHVAESPLFSQPIDRTFDPARRRSDCQPTPRYHP